MDFEGGYRENYSTTLTRAVGPTTRVGVRGTLPQPTPTDANAIWLAKNGNDANAGTSALPKLTLTGATGAIAALTVGKPTVHIFRNGYVGSLEFVTGAVTALPASRHIQVEQGEIAIISGPNTMTYGASSKVNGINFQNPNQLNGASATFDNCSVGNANGSGSWQILATVTITACTFWHEACLLIDVGGYLSTIVQCAFIAQTIGTPDTVANPLALGLGGSVGANTLNISRCVFIGFAAIMNYAITGRHYRVTFTSCAFVNCRNLISDQTTSVLSSILTFNYCLRGYINNWMAFSTGIPASLPAGYVLTITNDIPQATPPLFIDPLAGEGGDPEGLRLQWKGKATPTGGKYFLTSPLVGAGLAGVDVNPWDESTALNSYSFDPAIRILWPASANRITAAKPQNPVELRDVRGGPHGSYDNLLREWELAFGDGSNYASNMDLYRWIQLFRGTETKRWYPRGEGTTIFSGPDGAALGWQGQLTGSTFTPFLPGGGALVPFHWVGHWIMLTVAGVDRHFYISANTTTTFTLERKFFDAGGALPTNGIYSFRMEYIVVKFAIQDVTAAQEFFTSFLKGGAFGEFGTMLPIRANTAAFELKGYAFRLLEAIDNVEAE